MLDDYYSFYELLLRIDREGKKEHEIYAHNIPKSYIEKLQYDGYRITEYKELMACYNNEAIYNIRLKIEWD